MTTVLIKQPFFDTEDYVFLFCLPGTI